MSGKKIFELDEGKWNSEYGKILQRHPILMKIYRKIGTDTPNLIEELFERGIKAIYIIKTRMKRKPKSKELTPEEIERIADEIIEELKPELEKRRWDLTKFFVAGCLENELKQLKGIYLAIRSNHRLATCQAQPCIISMPIKRDGKLVMEENLLIL